MHGEAVARFRRTEGERAAQRIGLRAGQLLYVSEDRPRKLQQTRERELGFGFDAASLQHGEPFRPPRRGLEQRGLSDPGLSDEDEACRASVTRLPEQAVYPRELVRSTDEQRAAYDGVTRYASKTASTFRSDVRSVRRAFTSPSSAVYQFFAS